MTAQQLYYGNRKLAQVVQDAHWPGMWRVKLPRGELSDLVNLTRAKDAAQLLARQQNPRCRVPQLWNWRHA